MANRKVTQQIQNLWTEMSKAIDKAYSDVTTESMRQYMAGDDRALLRDYCNFACSYDKLRRLLDREKANERLHRSGNRPEGQLTVTAAAGLIICENIARGSELKEMPSALTFIQFRDTAAEARLLGFLIRNYVSDDWRKRVDSLDYAQLMKPAA